MWLFVIRWFNYCLSWFLSVKYAPNVPFTYQRTTTNQFVKWILFLLTQTSFTPDKYCTTKKTLKQHCKLYSQVYVSRMGYPHFYFSNVWLCINPPSNYTRQMYSYKITLLHVWGGARVEKEAGPIRISMGTRQQHMLMRKLIHSVHSFTCRNVDVCRNIQVSFLINRNGECFSA